MESAAPASGSPRPLFEDGLGKRFHAVSPAGEPLEVLALRDTLIATPSFEVALRERVTTLADFSHASFGRLRGLKRLDPATASLALVSDRVTGSRLSEVMKAAEEQLFPVQANAALCVLRQLVPAMAALHEKHASLSHGAIALERLVITPNMRVVIVEHALGSALEQLHYSPERYWTELQVATPRTAGTPQFDQRTDVMQIGIVGLAMIYGRPLAVEETQERLGALAEGAWGVTESGGAAPLPAAVRTWLCRMLQLDARHSYASAVEAAAELEKVCGTGDQSTHVAALKSLMAECAPKPAARPAAMPMPLPVPVPTETAKHTYVAVSAPSPAPAPSAAPSPAPAPSAAPSPAPAPAPRAPLAVASSAPSAMPASTNVPSSVSNTVRAIASARKIDGAPRTWWRNPRVAAAAVIIVLVSAGLFAGRSYLSQPAAAEVTGTLIAESTPAGVPVSIDGSPRGVTPLTLSLAPGSHKLEFASDAGVRTMPLTITAGGTVSQFVEFPKPAVQTGQLQVRTEPSGARVTVDGMLFGPSPITVDTLSPGVHTVVLSNELGSVTHQVTVTAGATASLVVPMAAPQGVPVSGWIALNAPVEVQVFENDQLLGSSRSDRIMVSAGRHDLSIVNDTVGYRVTKTMTVAPGQVSQVKLEWPTGSMALNAQPWADVWIDGEHIGETPIANVTLPIGPHEVVFRHPQLGEQAVRTTVTAKAPTRVSVNLAQR